MRQLAFWTNPLNDLVASAREAGSPVAGLDESARAARFPRDALSARGGPTSFRLGALLCPGSDGLEQVHNKVMGPAGKLCGPVGRRTRMVDRRQGARVLVLTAGALSGQVSARRLGEPGEESPYCGVACLAMRARI